MNIDSDLIEDVPVPEDGLQGVMGKGNRALRRRRAATVAGSTVLAAVMFIGIIAARSGTDERLSTAGSLPPPAIVPPANVPLDDTPLLALPAPALAANPAIPAGWQTVAYGFGQIAVPGDWQPLLNATCGITVPVVFLGDATFASGGCAVPSAFVRLTSITNACNDSKTLELGCSAGREVNGLTVQQISPGKCVCGTVSYYVADLQFRIDFTTVDSATADQILNTLTLSPQARVLAAGPLADTSTWRPVVEQGVGLRVPSNWPTRRLTETDPGTGGCGGNPFTGFPRTLRLGQGGGSTVACPPVLKPWPRLWVDGAWVAAHAPYATEPADREVITIAGKRFIVVSPAGSDFVILEIGGATIAVGIGSDLSIARAIFRTITVDGLFLSQSTPLPSAKPTAGPEVPTAPVPSTTTTVPATLPAIVERP